MVIVLVVITVIGNSGIVLVAIRNRHVLVMSVLVLNVGLVSRLQQFVVVIRIVICLEK